MKQAEPIKKNRALSYVTCHMSLRGGFAAFTTVIFIMGISAVIVGGFTLVSLREVTVTRNQQSSLLGYYAAESGAEDAIYRFVTGKQIVTGETVGTGSATGTITIATVGNQKTITVDGVSGAIHRLVSIDLRQEASPVGFSYGVQVGDAGLSLGDGSKIIGDVFSNGNILGAGETKSTITGTAQAAASSRIEDVKVGVNAYADTLKDCRIQGNAFYVSSITNCTVATSTSQMSQEIAPIGFPIAESQIDDWKADAAAGGTQGTTAIGSNQTISLGPRKINGSLSIGNGNVITVNGTVWVAGSVSFGNSNLLKLSSGYGANGGVFIADGPIDFGNNISLQGSGETGSYLMIISTYGPAGAIDIGNSASSSILYAPNGIIDIGNGLSLREATGRGLEVGNNASVAYEAGLLNLNFTSGPTASWIVKSWKEVQ